MYEPYVQPNIRWTQKCF